MNQKISGGLQDPYFYYYHKISILTLKYKIRHENCIKNTLNKGRVRVETPPPFPHCL